MALDRVHGTRPTQAACDEIGPLEGRSTEAQKGGMLRGKGASLGQQQSDTHGSQHNIAGLHDHSGPNTGLRDHLSYALYSQLKR
ncbi:MAG: hypothetical protein FRX49_10184 [Trebouxia sp. A1-2]|nr:MAG: hypothetical protein FRX49_10184 [Trebouxia sp. A1-2]